MRPQRRWRSPEGGCTAWGDRVRTRFDTPGPSCAAHWPGVALDRAFPPRVSGQAISFQGTRVIPRLRTGRQAQGRDNFPHMSKVPQTRRELEQQLDEHVAFLKDSAEAYDSGKTHEAKRLATSMRVLLHDTSSSHSLLKQLGKKTMAFLDTAGNIDPQNLLPESLLTMFWSGGLSNYLPKLDDLHGHRSFAPFEQWWKATVIDDRCGNVLSRRDLVLIMANQDGGAHVDPGVDSKYHRISRQFAMNFTAHHKETGASDFIRLVERASVRQIAHELLKTLDPSYGCNNRLSISDAHDYVEIKFTVPAPPKIVGTDPCPCGSGRSFKECHGTL